MTAALALAVAVGAAGFVPMDVPPVRVSTAAPVADQAQWLTRDQAVAAYRVLRAQTEVMRLCQPCGERVPVLEPVARPVVAYVPDEPYADDTGHYEIVLLPSGNAVDLAYVYVRVGTRWTNLARHVGMEVSGVTTILL